MVKVLFSLVYRSHLFLHSFLVSSFSLTPPSASGTSIQLVPQNLKLGRTEVPILIKDFQGLSCAQAQSLQLTVCKCMDNGVCKDKLIGAKSVGLGPGAVALIILAFLLMLRKLSFHIISEAL